MGSGGAASMMSALHCWSAPSIHAAIHALAAQSVNTLRALRRSPAKSEAQLAPWTWRAARWP